MEIKKLSNGLSCIFVDNSASDVVSVQIWIKCGSVYEQKKEYGVSIKDPREGRKILVDVNTMVEYIAAQRENK